MRKMVVIPTYWSRKSTEKWQEGDAVYDHPTPLDHEGTLGRTLESMKLLKDNDYKLVLLLCPTTMDILNEARTKVSKILRAANLGVDSYIITPHELELIRNIASTNKVNPAAINLLSLHGYANVRNMCIYSAYILGADVAMLIDDDELFEKENFIELATEYIGRRMYGKTIDGVAGYYLNKKNEYYDDVNIEPWMTYWNRFGSKTKAFDKIIGSPPRLKPTPFAFGGAMIIHRNLFKTVPFDPRITRGEDIDYLINSKMFGFHFFLDRELSIKHLPPKKSHPIWKRFREDIHRFMYEKAKIETQYEVPNMNLVDASEFDPYPGAFLKPGLEDMVFKANVMLAMDYMSQNDMEGARECIKNIYISKYEAKPHDDVFTYFRELQRSWRELLAFTKSHMMIVRDIVEYCDEECQELRKEKKSVVCEDLSPEEVQVLLEQTAFFGHMDKDFKEIISGVAKVNVFKKDEVITYAGQKNDRLYIISSGSVRVTRKNEESEEVILALLKKNEYFGETNLVNEVVSVDIIAEEETILISFDEEEILSLIETYPKVGVDLLMMITRKLATKLSNSNKRYMDAATKNTELTMQ